MYIRVAIFCTSLITENCTLSISGYNDSPIDFFEEAYRILKPQGKVGILHWRSDVETPRGPHLSIRPKPDQILQWIDRLKFNIFKEPVVIEPYHYGLILSKL